MELHEAINLAMFTGLIGFLGNQLIHNLSIKKDNVSINRERFLEHVHNLDNFMKYMLEINYLESEISNLEELSKSLNMNLQLLSTEITKVGKEQTHINKRMKEGIDSKKLNDLGSKIVLLSGQLSDHSIKLESLENRNQEIENQISQHRKKLNDLHEHLLMDDIESSLVIIDPTGEILNDLTELQNIYLNSENSSINFSRAIQLRTNIKRSITEKIHNFK